MPPGWTFETHTLGSTSLNHCRHPCGVYTASPTGAWNDYERQGYLDENSYQCQAVRIGGVGPLGVFSDLTRLSTQRDVKAELPRSV